MGGGQSSFGFKAVDRAAICVKRRRAAGHVYASNPRPSSSFKVTSSRAESVTACPLTTTKVDAP